jgi:hypothetical protein
MLKRLLGISVILLLLVACGQSDEEIDALVEAKVTEILANMPDPTPIPEPTPITIPTPLPTATSVPPPTPMPTATPTPSLIVFSAEFDPNDLKWNGKEFVIEEPQACLDFSKKLTRNKGYRYLKNNSWVGIKSISDCGAGLPPMIKANAGLLVIEVDKRGTNINPRKCQIQNRVVSKNLMYYYDVETVFELTETIDNPNSILLGLRRFRDRESKPLNLPNEYLTFKISGTCIPN